MEADIEWLAAGDPAIRWQALRDLAGAAETVYGPERARVATEGWGAAVLGRQGEDGHWRVASAEWPEAPTLYSLLLLRSLGVDPDGPEARRAVDRVQEGVRWLYWDQRPFFDGEVEPCINGGVLAAGAYFGVAPDALVDRLLGEQLADGGWNCEAANGSTRSSFPTYWRYDVLRALDHLREAGVARDERMDEALAMVAGARDAHGRWPLGPAYRFDHVGVAMDEGEGKPSRWVTLRAARVLSALAA